MKPAAWRKVEGSRVYRDLKPAANANTIDSSTPKFADHGLHLRLIYEALRAGITA